VAPGVDSNHGSRLYQKRVRLFRSVLGVAVFALAWILNRDHFRRLVAELGNGPLDRNALAPQGIDMCARCCTAIPHPLLVAGSLMLHGKWVRRAVPVIERLVYGRKLPKRLLAAPREDLVQIPSKK
jgi:hypothetical protein